MADFVHQYVGALLNAQHNLAQQHPEVIVTDVMYTSKQLYSLNLMNLMMMGVIMKTISEVAPVVTDAVWLDRLGHAVDQSEALPWPTWILNQDPSMGL